MNRHIVTIHQGGRFTLPATIRRELDLHPGDSVVWFEREGKIHFRKANSDEVAETENDSDRHTSSGSDTRNREG